MSSPLVRLQARIAGQLARERMGERFAGQVNYEATPVAGLGLARVDGQLVDSTVGEEKSAGDLVAMANVGRPAAAIYSPQGGAAVVMAAAATSAAGGGVTVHAQLSGLGADDHTHYLNIERGDARYYTKPEEDAWRAAHIALPDIHHNHATAGAPLTIDGGQYISLLYNSTLLNDGSNKLGVNQAYNFAWTSSHSWAMNTTLSSAGTVIPPGIAPGYGWSIVNPTSGDATLTIPNIWVGNLHAQAFIADVARADVGEEVWTRSRAVLADDLQLPKINDTIDMVVEVPPGIDPATFDLFGANHYVRLRIFDSTQGLTIADAWGTVTRKASLDKAAVKAERPSQQKPEGVAGAPAQQGYSFKLLYSDAAADPLAVPAKEGAQIMAGALVMGYGLPGDSFVLVTVIKDGGPYTAYYRWGINLTDGTVVGTAKPWQGQYWKLLTRIGNLEGQVDTAFGGALHGAGLYSENVYLKGRIVIAAGSDVPWGAVSGSGKPQDNATYGSPWNLVSGTGKPQDNATYGSPWDLVTGAGKPQDNATRGATWNVDMLPPGYLKAPGGTPGLYMTGTELGYWSGAAWNTYLDSGGNFVFSSAPAVPQQGDTQLAYFAGKTVKVNGQTVTIPATLAGKLYTLLIRDEHNNPIAAADGTFWHKTWWADTSTGALHAGPNGEVMLHNWGLSMIAYHGNDITPSNNVKALSFFDDTDSAIANVERARARIWAGREMDPEAAGSTYIVTSMLQMEVGGSASGYIDSDDRPRLALFNYGHETDGRLLEASEWDEIHLYANHGTQGGVIRLGASTIIGDGDVWARSFMPSGGSKALGSGTNRFDAIYARTIYTDSVVAPQFTGMNTVGVELINSSYAINASGDEHIWGQSPGTYWTVAHADNGQAFFNPADQQHIVVDQTGWYRVSYSITFYQHDHATFVRVFAAGGAVAYDTLHAMSSSWRVSASGDMYLYAGQKLSLIVKSPVGFEPGNYGRFVMIRSGTNGTPSVQMWDSSGNAHIRSASASAAQLVVESTNAGGVMDLRVTGQITTGSGLLDGVNLAHLSREWESHKSGADIDNTLEHRNQGPHPQYLLRAEVGSLVATHQYVNEMVQASNSGGVTSGENIPHSTLLGLNQGDDHPQYVSNALARTITARHTFSPPIVGAPFLLGTNALGQMVTGLNAQYLGGHTWDDIAMTPAEVLVAMLQVDGTGSLLDADFLDGRHSTDFALSSVIVGAGAGLSGGGPLTASFSLAVGAGAGIEVLADTVGLAASVAGEGLLYDTGVLSLHPALAGAGLTYNTGALAVGQGFGIVVGADDVAVDVTAGYTWTGPHIFESTITARHIAPELTDTYDLGTSAYWWRQQFVSQINAAIFAVQTVNLHDGWIMVPKDTGKLPAVAHGQTEIDFGKAMTPGDFLVIRNRNVDGTTAVEYMQLGTLVSGTTYNVSRDKAATGATYNWPVDTSYAVLGQAGDGRVEINSYDTPRISVIAQGAAYNVQTETVRIGDINGMPGVTQQQWGIYIGNASKYLKWDGTSLTIAGDGNGITNIDGGKITTGSITGEQISLSTSLAIGPASTWGSDGVQLEYHGGDPRVYIGNGSNRYFKFDGNTITWQAANASLDANGYLSATQATLSGAITATSGSITGIFTIGASGSLTFGGSTGILSDDGILLSGDIGWDGAKGPIVWYVTPSTKTTLAGKLVVGRLDSYGEKYGFGFQVPARGIYPDMWVSIGSSGYYRIWHSGNLDPYNLSTTGGTVFTVRTSATSATDCIVRIGGARPGSNAYMPASVEFNNNVAGYGTGYVDYLMAKIGAIDPAGSATLQRGALVFYTNGGGGLAERMRIDYDGAVTIGGSTAVTKGMISVSGNRWDVLPWIDSSGVLEVGRYIDFHNADAGTEDYSVRLETGGANLGLSINGNTVWHNGNTSFVARRDSANTFDLTITCNAGIYGVTVGCSSSGGQFLVSSRNGYGDFILYNVSNVFRIWYASDKFTVDTSGHAWAAGNVTAAGYLWAYNGYGWLQLGPQNYDWCHLSTDRAKFYISKPLCVDGNLWSYNSDFTLGRGTNGVMTNRMTFYTWGTYVNQNLTIEDVFAMTNTQGAVNNPASGVKLFLSLIGGVTYLQARFSNGVTKNVASNA